jgi:hypothetical protein
MGGVNIPRRGVHSPDAYLALDASTATGEIITAVDEV